MKEVLLLWAGRRGEAAVESWAAAYSRRIGRHVAFREVRLRPEGGRQGDPGRARAREGERLLAHVTPADVLVALDEHGALRTTRELAEFLAERLARGRVVFAVGSDLGLDGRVLAAAEHTLALSPLTLSHQLARLVLLEQLYRCLDLLAGGPYHRGEVGPVGYNQPQRRRR